MSRRHREKPGIIVSKTARGGLSPASAFDAEQLDGEPIGAEYDLKRRARRSIPLQRTYWKTLKLFCDATDLFPTSDHLHDALKHDLGYVTVRQDLNGRPYIVADSTAFDAMKTDAEFRPYFDKAMARLAEVGGFDPLAWLEDEKQRRAAA